jgi:hypothetical protein
MKKLLAAGLLALSALLWVSPVAADKRLFTDAFTPQEFSARRQAVMAAIGDGVAIVSGAYDTATYTKFREEDEPELARARLELDIRAAIELERLAVLAVRRAEAVLVLVGTVVQRAGEEAPVVALLELHRVHARVLGEDEELLCLLHRPLVVVADLGDHEAVGVVGDPPTVDHQLAHGAIVPLRCPAGCADYTTDDRRQAG